MTRARQDRLLRMLVREPGWMTAATLADRLGVTTRSVRSYVTAINSRIGEGVAVESGPSGYRAGAEAPRALQAVPASHGSPRDRLSALVNRLLDEQDGVDVFEIADEMFVSSATVEADLARVRALLDGTELTLERDGSRVRLRGSEIAQRRLLSRLVHDEMEDGAYSAAALRRALGEHSPVLSSLSPFKEALVAQLVELGYYVNEYGMNDVLAHVGIAADRVGRGRILENDSAGPGRADDALQRVAEVIRALGGTHLGVDFGIGDARHLASVVLTRVVAPGEGTIRVPVDPQLRDAVREAVAEAASAFLVDILDEDFLERLALHVQNLRERAREQAWSRNPLTRSLKSSYPMIFEVAVHVAAGVSERLEIPLHDDEIAYIAMHIGGQLERRRDEERLTATIVCPGYYELHELLRSRIARSLGQAVEVTAVDTRVDPEWASFRTDLVLATIDPPASAGLSSDRVVRIQPFLTPADVERVQAVVARLRRAHRLGRLRAELDNYFSPAAFVAGLPATMDDEAVIARLGEMLRDAGVVDDAYLERVIARERMSSTAFTDVLAVPHAVGHTVPRTAIAIGVAESSLAWGDARVQVVALVAFSEHDREAFQTVFEQFVGVFNELESAQRIIRRATSLPAFLDELVAVIDA